MSQRSARFYVAVALGVAAVSAAVLLRQPRPSSGGVEPPPGAIVRWCADGLAPIPGGGCFAAPAEIKPNATPLVVYLHGRHAPVNVGDELERQTRVARLATARGYAVLALRGAQGQCSDPAYAAFWCWPSNERNASDGAAFVARWSDALRAAEAKIGRERRVLLGFSNGGYFAALIASRELMSFDAVAVAHAGPVMPMRPSSPSPPPMLLVTAEDDSANPEMLRLDAELTREGWLHATVEREGGHALTEWDVETALTFFDRTRAESLPLTPPLATRSRARTAERRGADPADAGAPEAPSSPPPEDVLDTPQPPWDAQSTDPSPE
ncbi:MAG: hypothetical protein KF819_11770 [Labilithrix sp.]|nr:hypothetical protein [Labilithrix sp.]